MDAQQFIVIPQWGNPLGYFLLDRDKGLRWQVEKAFEDPYQTAYHYRFTHLNTRGKAVTEAAYPGFALDKSISRAYCERAARWFLTNYFSFRELHYVFTSVPDLGLPGYYPLLGRRDYSKTLSSVQLPEKPVLQPGDFELSWE